MFDDGEAAGVWVNAADDPDRCSFTLPARVRRGDLLLTVSTGGAQPGARRVAARASSRRSSGPEYATLLEVLAEERERVRAEGRPTDGPGWREALDSGMLDLIRDGRCRGSTGAAADVSVVVIGLNHRSASLDLLERMTVDGARLPKALHDLAGRENLSEAVVLSTCNRTEVYAVAERFHGGFHDVRDFLAELAFLAPEDFADHLYVHHDERRRRATSSRSPPGSTRPCSASREILGQVGAAWDSAREEGAAGATLNLLFRHALEAGKRVRTETGIARGITSVSQAAVALAADRLGGLGRAPGCSSSAPARWARAWPSPWPTPARPRCSSPTAPQRPPSRSPGASAAGPCL